MKRLLAALFVPMLLFATRNSAKEWPKAVRTPRSHRLEPGPRPVDVALPVPESSAEASPVEEADEHFEGACGDCDLDDRSQLFK